MTRNPGDSRVMSFADRIVKIEDGVVARPAEVGPVPAGLLVHNVEQAGMSLA